MRRLLFLTCWLAGICRAEELGPANPASCPRLRIRWTNYCSRLHIDQCRCRLSRGALFNQSAGILELMRSSRDSLPLASWLLKNNGKHSNTTNTEHPRPHKVCLILFRYGTPRTVRYHKQPDVVDEPTATATFGRHSWVSHFTSHRRL